MRNVLLILAAGLLLLPAGCGSSSQSTNSSEGVLEKGVPIPPPDANSNGGANPRAANNRKQRIDADPAATPEATEPRPAAENSEVSVIMNPDGSITEFRVWRAHPVIDRAEATWMRPDMKTVKVYLKNGSVLETETDKVPYLHAVPAAELVDIVSRKDVRPPAPGPGRK